MRIVSTIDPALSDEHVIAVDPPLMPNLPDVWRRRINPFTGRSLSDRALTAEQDARAGIQRLRGQSVTAGIVSGLDLLLEPNGIGAAPAKARLQILPGVGLARSGEDVSVTSPRSIAIGDLPVRARVDILDAIDANQPAPPSPVPSGSPDPDAIPGGLFAGLYPELPRRLARPTLGGLITNPAATALPRLAVLVAQPVTATILASARDSCAPDPRGDPYDDLRLIDGVRLLLDFWPAEMTARTGGPDYALPGAGPALRNRLAYRIFNAERAMAPAEMHPWEAVGTPLALIAFNPDWTLNFIDRACVVRLGGRPGMRTPLVPNTGNALLWQARVSQFAEHITSLPDLTPTTLTAAFHQLPPVGFLPIDVVDLANRRQIFFPAGFGVSLAPMPLEQVDLVVGESAALLPFNLDIIDEVELLVPISERLYEPGLLEIASVDHAFQQVVTRAVADRTDGLVRRELIRRRRDVLMDGATGARPAWPTADTAAVEILPDPAGRGPIGCTRVREVQAVTGQPPRQLTLSRAGSSLTVDKGDTLYVWAKIADATGLTGFQLRFGVSAKNGLPADMTHAVFWGAPDALPDVASAANNGVVRMGNLPPAGQWVRLDMPADRAWAIAGSPLTGIACDGMVFCQRGGKMQWGPVGKISAGGLETVWIGDDAPPGSQVFDTIGTAPVWPFVPAGINAAPDPPEDDYGTAESGGARSAAPVLAFRARWPQPFLAGDFTDLDEGGIDGFVAAVEARLKATNDAIDLGFVRARSDIYRVRQYMLGADSASRLVTSPSLADIAVRDESARAASTDIAAYVKTAFTTTVQPGPSAPTPAPTPTGVQPPAARIDLRASTMLVQDFNLSTAMIASTGAAKVSTTPVGRTTTANRVIATSTVVKSGSLEQLASARAVGLEKLPSPIDVQSSSPLPSSVERTASVAERLTPPPAVDAQAYAIAGKLAAYTAVSQLITGGVAGQRPQGVALGDLPSPGYRVPPITDPNNPPPLSPAPKNTVADVLADLLKPAGQRVYQDTDAMTAGPSQAARHESDYFTAAVGAIDNTIALMRLVEGRIDLYNKLVADARAVRAELTDHVADADSRLRTTEVSVEEARQDYGIANALLAEEQARVAALNARRKAILDANASVVLFRRPRRAKRVMPAPTITATPADTPPPIVACASEHPAVPEEIHSYVTLMQDAPVAWFPNVHPILIRIDRLDAMRAALTSVQQRATLVPAAIAAPISASPALQAVSYVMIAQRATLELRRQSAMQLDVSAVQATSLTNARLVLINQAAMADLIAGAHNRAIVSRAVAAELEQIGMAAACLHDSFGEVPPIGRLQWADLLSEFKAPMPLADLNGLAGWSALPMDLRKRQQGLVDWLFSRVAPSIPAAVSAINELVRISLLMAAQAPVDRLIPAKLVAPTPARIGTRLSAYADSSIARIGMTVLVRDANAQLLAHAVVDDVQDGVAHSRIVKTFGAVDTIPTASRIELSDQKLVL
jgi:hypothetical protein